MLNRLLNPLESQSFFLFGARGTGKTTFLKKAFITERSRYIDLLEASTFNTYHRDPDTLIGELNYQSSDIDWIIIDEFQKVPPLLDVIHKLIEEYGLKFALIGSSARKIRHGSANLLAGRAFVNNLYPISYLELGDLFTLDEVLRWGSLPKMLDFHSAEERFSFLTTYTFTYLKEEILQEQLVRNLDPFSRFLEVAAQMNTETVNYSKIAREAGVSPNTVQQYFEILEDTLLGTLLPPYSKSVRKQQRASPKFYFFDTGVQRALAKTITVGITPSSYAYGTLFETFIINEVVKLNSYFRKNYSLSYLRTKSGAEIDLIVERPGLPDALIEIKSASDTSNIDLSHLKSLGKDFSDAELYCFSQDERNRIEGGVSYLHWRKGFEELGVTQSSF